MYDIVKDALGLSDDINLAVKIGIIIVVLVAVNLVLQVMNLLKEVLLKRKDQKLFRSNLIEEKKIKFAIFLFRELERLSYFQVTECDSMITQINRVEKLSSRHFLLMDKWLIQSSGNLLDYYREIVTDFSKKSFEKEEGLMNEYRKRFNR